MGEPRCWETQAVVLQSPAAKKLEEEGWEPFAAYYVIRHAAPGNAVCVYRRLVAATPPSSRERP
jgi:hypothetical protein